MKIVPNIISTKDLSYIEDMLNWNFILIKKINNNLSCIEDKNVINILNNAYKVLYDNYNSLLNILD